MTPERGPVHFPKGTKFEFDDEVALIFDNMAERSIPMYREAHRVHASLVGDMLREKPILGVLDIGASTGAFAEALCKESGGQWPTNLIYQAIDNSEAMCKRISHRFPRAVVTQADIMNPPAIDFRPDVISMMYVLQFIPRTHKAQVLEWVYDLLPPDGVLFLGQKDVFPGGIGRIFQDQYIKFRLANGYTKEEIDAKTEALKHSMWCSNPAELRDMLYGIGFNLVVETTRWLNFSTFICAK
jgi:tRNA (cmo5U34)-methyltransferase